MKTLHWRWLLAVGMGSALVLSGCSSGPNDPNPMTSGGAGTGGTGTGGKGTQIFGFAAYTLLTATEAADGGAAPTTYTSATCNTCHGEQGQGLEFLAPEIRHTPPDYATFIVRNGRIDTKGMQSGMVKFPNLPSGTATVVPDADLTAILAWLNGLPKPSTGKGLYKDFCGNCHGPSEPTGGSVPVAIRGLMASVVSAKVRSGSGMDITMRAAFMPKFDPALLSDSDLALIQGYLGSN